MIRIYLQRLGEKLGAKKETLILAGPTKLLAKAREVGAIRQLKHPKCNIQLLASAHDKIDPLHKQMMQYLIRGMPKRSTVLFERCAQRFDYERMKRNYNDWVEQHPNNEITVLLSALQGTSQINVKNCDMKYDIMCDLGTRIQLSGSFFQYTIDAIRQYGEYLLMINKYIDTYGEHVMSNMLKFKRLEDEPIYPTLDRRIPIHWVNPFYNSLRSIDDLLAFRGGHKDMIYNHKSFFIIERNYYMCSILLAEVEKNNDITMIVGAEHVPGIEYIWNELNNNNTEVKKKMDDIVHQIDNYKPMDIPKWQKNLITNLGLKQTDVPRLRTHFEAYFDAIGAKKVNNKVNIMRKLDILQAYMHIHRPEGIIEGID